MTIAPPAPAPPSVRRPLHGLDAAVGIAASTGEPAWLAALRGSAVRRFAETGLPGSHDEEWRFTPLAELSRQPFVAVENPGSVPATTITPHLLGNVDWPLIVVVDGLVQPDLSRLTGLPAGVTFLSLGDALARELPVLERHFGRHATADTTPFAAASMAAWRDGAVLHLAPDVRLDTPVRVLHVVTGTAARAIVSPRLLVVLEANAAATLVESYADIGHATTHLTNACTEVVLGAGARLEHLRLQLEPADAWHVGCTVVDQQRDSHYRSFTLARGARLSRHDLHARLNDTNIETLLYGLYLTRGEQLADNHTAIFHDHPHCNSWEVYKGVLADRSRAVFNGKVLVQPEAQKTDAKQTNRNLLLSDEAKVDTKPQLEIFADDVRCTHGATVGPLNVDQRYYLQTRGIAGREAEVLLITAFVAEVVAEIVQPVLRERVDGMVREAMNAMIPG
ncbi:MAG TPA: Fe-S cluster assembly protein SufD [Gemmatimonadales bacterium]|jgi:Fe-S cluster assembly protein SufD